ncbi:MAG: hypothetical protein ISS69_03615 [Phycisphaerae bacterium]|nr:hypothetical protein [Phycisphaerae bacterium]
MKTFVAISALFFLVLSGASAHGAATKVLVGHWSLDDRADGGKVTDSSPNALHGSLNTNTSDLSGKGKVDRSLGFTGNTVVDLSRHAAVLGKLKDFTVSMWIQHTPGPSRMLFTWSDGSLNHRVQVEVHNATLHFGWQNGGAWRSFATRPLKWEKGKWYHVVFVNDTAAGKTIVRSNDGVRATNPSTFAPADLKARVTCVQIGGLNGAYQFTGRIDDVRLYNIALRNSDIRSMFGGGKISGKPAVSVPLAKLSPLEKDWHFQTEKQSLIPRAQAEIGWAQDIAQRMIRDGVEKAKLAGESSALQSLKTQAAEMSNDPDTDELKAWELYRAVRKVKRQLMFKRREVDFDEVVFVDVPYTRGREWQHQSRYRSIMLAAHGGELAVLKGLSGGGRLRKLAPVGDPAGFLRPDVSYDGKKVLFCMKPQADKGYHLYEIGADGKGLRQLTSGGYSDLDPVYLPDGNIIFLTSRANVYGGCAPWAPQHVIARCDSNGKNIYILSLASEPEYSPSILNDGRVIYTRWEYNDRGLNRIQSLWTMNPDGTASNTYWGNHSVWPDHLGEARSIPGTSLVMFNGMGHHDMYRGCVGIVDVAAGLNYPKGLKKVTADVPWPEVGNGPAHVGPVVADYHASGLFGGYKSPYPLSKELFLVSARTGQRNARNSASEPNRGLFKLYLMDIHGNRELIHQGKNNVLYAQPLRARPRPAMRPDMTVWPGSEKDGKPIAPGRFYSGNVYEGMDEKVKGLAKYLRVIECVQRNYTTGCVDGGGSPFGSGSSVALDSPQFRGGNPGKKVIDKPWGDGAILAGPAIAIASNTRLKRVLGTVPVAADGSFSFIAPPGKAVYFQLLDKHHLVLQSMRSWVNLMPGEQRGCVGCHKGQLNTPISGNVRNLANRPPDKITPPSWGVKTLSYVSDIQPIFDKNCAKCHQGKGKGKGRKKLDLTLRPDPKKRWGGIFPEPYITLTCGDNPVNNYATIGRAKPTIAGNFFIWESYPTFAPMTKWSYKSPLINMHLHGKHNKVKLTEEELRKLIVWIDTNCHFRGLNDILAIEDPDVNWFLNWPYRPRLGSAPYVNHLYRQDEFKSPEDRRTLLNRMRGKKD